MHFSTPSFVLIYQLHLFDYLHKLNRYICCTLVNFAFRIWMDKAPYGKHKQSMYKGRTFTYFQVKFFLFAKPWKAYSRTRTQAMRNAARLSYAIKIVGNVEKKIHHKLRFFFKCRKWIPREHLLIILSVFRWPYVVRWSSLWKGIKIDVIGWRPRF